MPLLTWDLHSGISYSYSSIGNHRSDKMASLLLPLFAALVVLMVDSAIELAMVSAMVGYLHHSGANQYPFQSDSGTTVLVNAKPKGLLLNEGHTSNGAAGTALVLICFGGFLVLWWHRQRQRRVSPIPIPILQHH